MTKEEEQVMDESLLEEVAFQNELDEHFAWLDEKDAEVGNHSCYDNRDTEDTSNGFMCKVCFFDYPF